MSLAPPSAPPDGVSGSEQSLESRFWRLQLDLATGGVRSLIYRGGHPRELVQEEERPHPFQIVARDAAGKVAELSRFSRARLRFDEAGASLTVESVLDGGLWRVVFGVRGGDSLLRVEMAPDPGFDRPAETSLPPGGLSDSGWTAGGADWMRRETDGFQLVVRGSGIACRPESGCLVFPGNRPARFVLGTTAPGDAAAAAWVRERAE